MGDVAAIMPQDGGYGTILRHNPETSKAQTGARIQQTNVCLSGYCMYQAIMLRSGRVLMQPQAWPRQKQQLQKRC